MFDHILVPLDGSALAECVLPHVVAMAGACRAKVTLIHVVERPRAAPGGPFDPMKWRMQQAEAQAYLNKAARRLSDAGQPADVAILEGTAASRIIEFAHARTVSLITLSTHGRSGPSNWNVSGTVQKVIQRAYVPMMLVRARQPDTSRLTELRYRRLLVPLDGSQRAECALPVATTLARCHGSGLLLAHVVCRPRTPRQTPIDHRDLELVDCLTERNRAEAERYLARCSSDVGLPSETHLLVGDSVTIALHDLVKREGVDLVVLSAHGFSGSDRWPYGRTAVSFIVYGASTLIIMQDLVPRLAPTSHAERVATQELVPNRLVHTADQPAPETLSAASTIGGR
jgi:nucleotide-binding universal stress UspA family protein